MKKNNFIKNKKAQQSSEQLPGLLIVIIVVVLSLIFLFSLGVNKFWKFLPNASDFFKKDSSENIENSLIDTSDSSKNLEENSLDKNIIEKVCIKNIFWSDKNKNRILDNKIKEGDAFITLEIEEILKCGKYKIFVYSNIKEDSNRIIDIDKNFIQNNLQNNKIFIKQELKDKGFFSNGEYYFLIKNLEQKETALSSKLIVN